MKSCTNTLSSEVNPLFIKYQETKSEKEFTTIITKIVPYLKRYGFRFFRERFDLCDECVSNTTLKIWLKSDQFDGSLKFLNWATTIFRNEAFDLLKAENRLYNIETYYDNNIICEDVMYHGKDIKEMDDYEILSCESDVIDQKLFDEIYECINELSANKKDIFVKYYNITSNGLMTCKEKTINELSSEENISTNTIKTRLRTARIDLMNNVKNNLFYKYSSYNQV